MSLIRAINSLEELINYIGSNELDSELEHHFDSVMEYVNKNVDQAVFQKYQLDGELTRARELANLWVNSVKRKQERLKRLMFEAAKRSGGKLKTSSCSISIQEKSSSSIEITDFDRCATHYASCVKVTTEDNRRIITIDKNDLRNHVDFHMGYGFHVKTDSKETLYVSGPRG